MQKWYNIHMKKKTKLVDLSAMSRSEIEEYAQNLAMKNETLELENSWLMEQFRLQKKKQFGTSSEQTPEEQFSMLLNEAEEWSDLDNLIEPDLQVRTKKQKGQKDKKIKNLPVEQIDYTLSAEERICPQCQMPFHEMKKVVRKELTIVPAKVMVTKHVQHVYACRTCEKEGTEATIRSAPMRKPILRNSLASPSALADVLSKKYVLGLPLYRQEQDWKRYGLDFGRHTLANWVIRGSQKYLSHLYEAMKMQLLTQAVLHADETEVQVLREPNRAAQSKSYMWLFRSGSVGPPCVLYRYQDTRSGTVAKDFLAGFTGFLHTDGYAGYNRVCEGEKITQVGCWAHARRKYDEALKALPKEAQVKADHIKRGLGYCNTLFQIEADAKGRNPEERQRYRQQYAAEKLDEYFDWVRQMEETVLPKSLLGKAITYSKNQEQSLRAYLLDGRLEISNNRAERSIKPFVLGRKNWLFTNSAKGAEASAVVYSIAETAKENGLVPFEYFKYLFEILPNMDCSNMEAMERLLPWSKALPEQCRIPDTQ